MIDREQNPDYLNDFLDYIATILNKSENTVKEYNYDIAHFLKHIKYQFKLANIKSIEEIKQLLLKKHTVRLRLKLRRVPRNL